MGDVLGVCAHYARHIGSEELFERAWDAADENGTLGAIGMMDSVTEEWDSTAEFSSSASSTPMLVGSAAEGHLTIDSLNLSEGIASSPPDRAEEEQQHEQEVEEEARGLTDLAEIEMHVQAHEVFDIQYLV